MNQITCTLILSLAIMADIQAQVWAPFGAEWTYGTQSVFTGTISYVRWKSAGDTVLNNYPYHRIQNQDRIIDGDYSDHFFTREDDNIIWLYNDSTGGFSKMFDFGQSTGAWWTTDFGTCPMTMKVIDTRMDTIQGMVSKSMKIEYQGPDTNTTPGIMWANRQVGGLERPLPFFDYQCNTVIPDNETYTGLRCYEDTAVGLWKRDTAQPCEYSTVGIATQSDDDEFNIYPNPFQKEIFLEHPGKSNLRILVRDVVGREVLAVNSRASDPIVRIQISGPPGMYFIEVRNPEDGSAQKNKVFKVLKE